MSSAKRPRLYILLDMYLGIDVGASKTLLALFDNHGKTSQETKFETPKSYDVFLQTLKKTLSEDRFDQELSAVCCAVPGKIDRRNGVGLFFGNLDWEHVPVKADLEKMLGHLPVFVENDAKLAGVYEAKVVSNKYRQVLYLTLSTGIGAGFIIDGKIDPFLANNEVGSMVLMHDGHLEKWEDFASGRALVKKYGLKASQIEDPKIWQAYAAAVAQGLDAILAVVQPEVIVIGGGVGSHLEKFQSFMEAELKKYQNNMVNIPPIIKAKRPEEAVIYGCYEYIKQNTA